MKTAGKIALGALAGIGLVTGGVAIAHSQKTEHGSGMAGHGPGMGHGAMKGHGPMSGHAANLATLKTELKLTAKQEPAWQAFEKAVRTQAEGMAKGHPRAAAGPDGMEKHMAFMEQRLAGMQAVHKARTDLYKALTTEQKAVLDQHGPRHRHG